MRKFLPLLILALAGCVVHSRRSLRDGPDGPPLTRAELERLSAAGISDELVAELLERRGAAPLSSDDVVALKKAGASDAVVEKALASERREPEIVMVDRPVYYYRYYHPYVWWYPHWYWYPSFGFSYSHWSRRSRVGIGIGW